jgi:hypothetical protein
MRMTEQEYREWVASRTEKLPVLPKVPRKQRSMNKTEGSFAWQLEAQVREGEITAYRYEALKFRMADHTFYTPDFMVIHNDGSLELIEVKGPHIREDAMIKFKVAREMFPWFKWSLMQKEREGWIKLY